MKASFFTVLVTVFLVVFAECGDIAVGDSGVRDRVRDLSLDLQNYAHSQCASLHQYTTVSSTSYTDLSEPNAFDAVLQNHSFVRIHSHVVMVNSRSPMKQTVVHRTGTNTGLGKGLTNGISRAQRYTSTKQRVQPFFPLHHPRQNMSFCVQVSKLAELGTTSFYEHMKKESKQSYVTILRNAVVSSEGQVALECGWLQHRQSCCNRVLKSGRTWRAELSSRINAQYPYEKAAWSSVSNLKHAVGGNLPVHEEVLVIDAAWDFNYYHFLVESLTRLVPFYHYLQRNTHIKIHIRAHEATMNMSDPNKVKRALDGLVIRQRLLRLLESEPSRVINGTVLARKVYLPSDMECASPLKHSTELHALLELMIHKADKVLQTNTCDIKWAQPTATTHYTSDSTTPKKPTTHAKIIIQARDCYNATLSGASKIRNSEKWRCFTSPQQDKLIDTAKGMFPQSEVVVARTSLTHALACDVQLYREADVVIGLHGAAMTNVMFMRPGTVLVEIVGQFDPRMPPVCGSFGPYSAVFGVHHFIYYYDGVVEGAELDIHDVLHKAYDYYISIRANAPYTSYDLSPF